MSTVIVFGPTGNVGSWAARTAQKQGAKVILAMRDPAKPVPGLDIEQEKTNGFERVQADLTKPDTVAAAVEKTKATRAFIYLSHGSSDHMKSTLQALKSAGITFVVFLSSYTIGERNLHDVPVDELIPYVHAQVEINLDEVFGPDHYVAVRPGSFATNSFELKAGILAGEVKNYGTSFQQDLITPVDMGQVSGTILAKGPKDNQRKVFLYGPQRLTQSDVAAEIGRALGKDIKVSSITKEELLAQFAATGTPRPIAEYLVRVRGGDVSLPRVLYEEGVENVQKYTERPATKFQEWLEENLDQFKA